MSGRYILFSSTLPADFDAGRGRRQLLGLQPGTGYVPKCERRRSRRRRAAPRPPCWSQRRAPPAALARLYGAFTAAAARRRRRLRAGARAERARRGTRDARTPASPPLHRTRIRAAAPRASRALPRDFCEHSPATKGGTVRLPPRTHSWSGPRAERGAARSVH